MPPKRPRSATTNFSPNMKKIIVEPNYRRLTQCTSRRIRNHIPSDVKFVQFQIDAGTNSNMAMAMRRYIENVKNENKVAFLIGVRNYAPNINPPNHAIAVYRWGDTLYCFDPWGTKRRVVSTKIFRIIKEIIGDVKTRIYDHQNLQAYNAFGVCVGLSSNFIMIMANQKVHIKQHYSRKIRNLMTRQTINNIRMNLESKTLAISKSLTPTSI
jgi:hypothetical protein